MKSPLLKNILAAVLGYVVMFAVSFPLMSLLWMALGEDGSFAPGTWDVSGPWIAGSVVLGTTVSLCGGLSCSKLAASGQGIAILVGLVVMFGIMGIVSGMPDAGAAALGRPEGISMFDAMTSARSPIWILWLNPVLGVIGVTVGATLQAGKVPWRN